MLRKLLILGSFLAVLALTGCFNASEDDQSVPWSRPADWERNAPGFGG